jgi:hypothetical protein
MNTCPIFNSYASTSIFIYVHICNRKFTVSTRWYPKFSGLFVKNMIINFFDVKEIVHEEFVPTGQTVNSGFYCDFCGDCVKMCKDVAQTLARTDLAASP